MAHAQTLDSTVNRFKRKSRRQQIADWLVERDNFDLSTDDETAQLRELLFMFQSEIPTVYLQENHQDEATAKDQRALARITNEFFNGLIDLVEPTYTAETSVVDPAYYDGE